MHIHLKIFFQRSSVIKEEMRARKPDLEVIYVDMISKDLDLNEMTRKKM